MPPPRFIARPCSSASRAARTLPAIARRPRSTSSGDQGDGTAQILGPDPDAFALSLHGARNYPFQRIPSDLDVDLPTGTGDDGYLEALDHALDEALYRRPPEIAFYLAGADPWEGDRLGRLALSKAGLRARDELALDRLLDAAVPLAVPPQHERRAVERCEQRGELTAGLRDVRHRAVELEHRPPLSLIHI